MPILSRFRFRPVPFVAAMLAVALGVSLGQWQTRRAVEKEAIGAALQARSTVAPLLLDGAMPDDPAALEFRRVRVRGTFVGTWPVYLDNRPHERRAGFHMLMPLRIAGSDRAVLVARGWLPRDPTDRARLPAIPTPAGIVEIEGRIRRQPGRVMQFGEVPPLRPGAIVQNVSVAEFGAASGLAMLPLLIEQEGADGAGLVRDWPQPSAGADKHRGYAFQWYGLAAAAFIFYLVTGFMRGTKQ